VHRPTSDTATINARLRAVEIALQAGPDTYTDLFRFAELVYRFADGSLPVALVVTRGLIREQDPTDPNALIPKETGPVQITDTQQFAVSVEAVDSKGFPTADDFTASSSDETIATVTEAEDGRTFTIVAGNPGSAVITITDGTLSATEAVDVVAGDTAKITIVEGPVAEQPAPEPEPTP